ncbi:hypothetical protein C4577_01800 [Candidatus Parcubacteria bacterium]|nr:MAG: hypothetical protein C4577_01800 [Candidatus Parcubacteria bacterium]
MADKVVSYPKFDWVQWQAYYRGHIRCVVDWEMLVGTKPIVGRYWWSNESDKIEVYFPWYTNGNWRCGSPKKVSLGKNDVIVSIPVVAFDNNKKFLVLDGCHRVRDLKPRIIVLDYVSVKKDKLCAFTDLLNPSHKVS